MNNQQNLNNQTPTQSILLIGNHSINNQFLQREVEKNNQYSFEIQSSEDIEASDTIKQSDIVLISFLLLASEGNINAALSKVIADKWIVYDVPKDTEKKAISDIQLLNCIHLKGIVYQDSPIEHLTRCLSTVSEDDFWLPRKVMAQMLNDVRPYTIKLQDMQNNLTKRELQIFKRLIKGASNIEISDELFISESTVKTHIYNIYKKLKVSNRKEAIHKAAYIAEIDFT